jgi:sec-independent protein translocase protein TatA
VFVLVVALLVLGPKRLPEVGRSLGRGLRDFKAAMNGEELHTDTITPSSAPPAESPTPVGEPVEQATSSTAPHPTQ